jgi:Na+-transporting NADH:ubiquinone oxidoreductase subunit A
VKPAAQQHYRVHVGGSLEPVLKGNLLDGEMKIVNGDVLGGSHLNGHSHAPFYCTGLTILREDRERHFLGWLAPGWNRLSHSGLFLSTWLRKRVEWSLGTSQNGSPRAMVLTGLYDRFMPMNIMVDYLVRAVLANDTDEAVKLGILETEPEDFALCAFACPSKMDLVGIMRRGLNMIEEEGI